MPESSTKKTVSAQPGLLQRIFGSSEMTPEMQQAVEIARKENPNLAPVQPYGPISRMFLGNAQGYTSPAQTIYLNPTQLQGMQPQDIADTIVHEQQHVNQMRERGSSAPRELLREIFADTGTPYGRRPDEMAAFQAERERRAKMGRTGELSVYPSFTNPSNYTLNADTRLPITSSFGRR